MEDNLGVEFIAKVTKWAGTQPDIQMAILVGSHARGDARSLSDIDFVILTEQPWRYIKDPAWASGLGAAERSVTENWGELDSLRVWYSNGQEVEFGFADRSWLSDPRDPGTSRVLDDGFRILFERTELHEGQRSS